jgi:Flp pilus assembly protein TadD
MVSATVPDSIPTRRRLEYARGYVALGLLTEGEKELAAINERDRDAIEVVAIKVDLYMEGKQWKRVPAVAKRLAEARPECEQAWIAWGYALRELQRIEEARDVLLRAEQVHGPTSPVLHYNLACYYSLLGDLPEAKRRLEIACRMGAEWETAAKTDPDLDALRKAAD